MGPRLSLAPLRALVENVLPAEVPGALLGLIGGHPSTYARSPRLWGAALVRFGIEGVYLSLDVMPDRLPTVLALIRQTDACLGVNVTVPYKEAVMPLLDEIDPAARAIGAVNTIVRTPGGRLIGSNTDGVGLVAALLRPFDGQSLLDTPYGLTVLLIGAGGAARAAAIALAPLLGPGTLLVANRSLDRARVIVERVEASGGRAIAVAEDALDMHLPAAELVINASVRGQAGTLEPYSALGPTGDVEANHAASRARVRLLPRDAVIYDMIYAPSETVTIRHAREAGLRAANGRWMNIAQAVEAFVEHVCARPLSATGADPQAVRDEATRVMAAAWGG